MPPKSKPVLPPAPPSKVVRQSVEEQIGSLFHWSEGFADWRLQVEERLERGEENFERLNIKVDRVDTKLGDLSHKLEARHNEAILIQQQVLMVVQGQRIPGMERPGLTDDLRALATELTGLKTLYDELKTTETGRKGWIAGAMVVISTMGAGIGWYFYDKFHALVLLLDHPTTKP